MAIEVTLDGDLAYIALTRVGRGAAVESVVVDDDDYGDIYAMGSIVLDFDREGRLVGIEITGGADRILPRDLLAQHGR